MADDTLTHKMLYKGETPAGYYRLVCPVCGRSVLFRLGERIVVEPGDEYARHVGFADMSNGEITTEAVVYD